MKSVVNLDIDAPRAKVAELFADPKNNAKWMDDVDVEPVSGTLGLPGCGGRVENPSRILNAFRFPDALS